jgi:hypothetical protein
MCQIPEGKKPSRTEFFDRSGHEIRCITPRTSDQRLHQGDQRTADCRTSHARRTGASIGSSSSFSGIFDRGLTSVSRQVTTVVQEMKFLKSHVVTQHLRFLLPPTWIMSVHGRSWPHRRLNTACCLLKQLTN